MDHLQQSFSVKFEFPVFFTQHLFASSNPLLRQFLAREAKGVKKKLLFVIDRGVADHHPNLRTEIRECFDSETAFEVAEDMLVLPGGEIVKNNESYFYKIVEAVNACGIDRHSYIVAIGGGAILDLVGYAAAVSHRGVRHIRIPTTVLSQNDSGVGVKNGINFFGKKNFLGTFSPPVAVFIDSYFLTTLNNDDWRSGMSEAIKVALIKDKAFFAWLEKNAVALAARNMDAMTYLVKRCAELHMQHIAGGDPFEKGSSRPLDFGHWSAHKLEQLTQFSLRHGDAVALGIIFDSTYSYLSNRLSLLELQRIISLSKTLGFALTHPHMQIKDSNAPILSGLNEFREHLGGALTIMLLDEIGKGVEVHEMQLNIMKDTSAWLEQNI
jgi:3-dehydroquinate synthase